MYEDIKEVLPSGVTLDGVRFLPDGTSLVRAHRGDKTLRYHWANGVLEEIGSAARKHIALGTLSHRARQRVLKDKRCRRARELAKRRRRELEK